MTALEKALEISRQERAFSLEDRVKGSPIRGDFTGSVSASWVRLDESGAGIVLYKGKEYKTKMIGITAIPKGTRVELSYAKGLYFSKY